MDPTSTTPLPSTSPPITNSLISPPITNSPSFGSAHHFLSLRLTNSNYLLWKAQVIPFLKGQNLYGHVDGTLLCPSDAIQAALWQQQDASIMSLLISSLSETILPLIIGKSTSKEIWDALHVSFGSASATRMLSLHLSFQRLQQKQGESVFDFLQRAKSLADEMGDAGKPLAPEDFNVHIFRGLRSDLQDIVPTLLSRPEPISFTDLQGLLLSHESIKAFQQLQLSELSPQAHSATTSSAQHNSPATPLDFSSSGLVVAALAALVIIEVLNKVDCGAPFANAQITLLPIGTIAHLVCLLHIVLLTHILPLTIQMQT